MDNLDFNGFDKSDNDNSINNDNDNSTNNNTDNLNCQGAPSFYSESYSKQPKKRKNNTVFQLILVALISSILGGGFVGVFFQFVLPVMQPSVKSYFSKIIPGNTLLNNSSQQDTSGLYKKIEIEKSDSAVTSIAEKVSPSIVGVKSTFQVQNFFFGDQEGGGEGSGIIIKSDGYIVTNNHVIESAMSGRTNKLSNGAKIEVILPNQKDKLYTATVIGRDEKTDLAVLKIDAENLPAAELGNSDELKVGELAVAIGNPGGLEYMGSVTAGIISGLNRTVKTEDGTTLTLVQTDAAINPGNSGGALVNSKGQVIGINTIKMAATGYEGLGFAIPINTVKDITGQLMQFKYVTGRPYLGISIDPRFTEDIAKQYNVPFGLLVYDVAPLSGAFKAGVQRNDIITKFDGQAIKTFDELDQLKNKHKPGDIIKVEIYRDKETMVLEIELTEDKGE